MMDNMRFGKIGLFEGHVHTVQLINAQVWKMKFPAIDWCLLQCFIFFFLKSKNNIPFIHFTRAHATVHTCLSDYTLSVCLLAGWQAGWLGYWFHMLARASWHLIKWLLVQRKCSYSFHVIILLRNTEPNPIFICFHSE